MATELGESFSKPRRRFLRKVALAAGALTLAGFAARFGLSLFSGQTGILGESRYSDQLFRDERLRDLVNSEISSEKDFFEFEMSTSLKRWRVDLNEWKLRIHGRVNRSTDLDMNRLMSMWLSTKSEYYTLECVYFDVKASTFSSSSAEFMATAKWTGVPLSTLLEDANVAPSAKYVIFRSVDGYDVGIPIDRAMHPGTLLAYKINDEVLPPKFGFPLRAIVPGFFGQMNPKRINEIEVVDYVHVGFWQRQENWSNELVVKTRSMIRYPEDHAKVRGRTPIAGVAFAGDRGISKVEVSVDGGETWSEAVLKKPLSPYTWVLWAYEWTPQTEGTCEILARAYDGKGEAQDPTVKEAWPEGASGYHSIRVTAE